MRVRAWDSHVNIEPEAWDQVARVASLPFIFKHVALMPDAHAGNGSTVGSVVATRGAIIPAAVGVDIGCGMMAQKTVLRASDLPDNLDAIRSSIEAFVPHGRTNNGGPGDVGAWEPNGEPNDVLTACNDLALDPRFRMIEDKYPQILRKPVNLWNHLGTLGTGNHFIEMCLDEEQNVWVMLHSGSRGIGNRIGTYFIDLAKRDMERWFINLPDKDLAYIPEGSAYFDDYMKALHWAQDYALMNRFIMMLHTLSAIGLHFGLKDVGQYSGPDVSAINCHHNYVARENHFNENVWITRKGAVRARLGDLGIIPGSMGAKSYIVRGLSNARSFHSCSHGAGRTMSRTQARRTISLEDHRKAVAGVSCRTDESVLDESPAAYKNIDDVMESQKDLVEIVHTLKQVVCVKG